MPTQHTQNWLGSKREAPLCTKTIPSEALSYKWFDKIQKEMWSIFSASHKSLINVKKLSVSRQKWHCVDAWHHAYSEHYTGTQRESKCVREKGKAWHLTKASKTKTFQPTCCQHHCQKGERQQEVQKNIFCGGDRSHFLVVRIFKSPQ